MAPTMIVTVLAFHLLLSGETEAFDWRTRILPVVILQVIAITVFAGHAYSNQRITRNEAGKWLLQFMLYIPFGMIEYWSRHVRDRRPELR